MKKLVVASLDKYKLNMTMFAQQEVVLTSLSSVIIRLSRGDSVWCPCLVVEWKQAGFWLKGKIGLAPIVTYVEELSRVV